MTGISPARERAQEFPRKRAHQDRTRRLLDDYGAEGLTVEDLRALTGWHHGQASGVLSAMHQQGDIARLVKTQNGCHIYVLPAYVNGRTTQPYGRTRRPVREDIEVTPEMVAAFFDALHEARTTAMPRYGRFKTAIEAAIQARP